MKPNGGISPRAIWMAGWSSGTAHVRKRQTLGKLNGRMCGGMDAQGQHMTRVGTDSTFLFHSPAGSGIGPAWTTRRVGRKIGRDAYPPRHGILCSSPAPPGQAPRRALSLFTSVHGSRPTG